MTIEAWVILAVLALVIVVGTWSALATEDSWDRKPAGRADDFDYHKATLGIYQEPGEEEWEQDLAALRLEQKHRLC